MRFNIIPVVFGGAKYDQLFPKNSYIDALSFESPEHLAKFLLKVGSDENLYNKYLEWKNEYEVIGPHSTSLCNLCAKIANQSEPNSYHSSDYLYEWWVKDGKCRQIEFLF
jgi:alpha-1,3-fucosyltransferase